MYGPSVDRVSDIISLEYADDLIILALSRGDMMRKLRCLRDYSDINHLTVNVSKTKIVQFRKCGRPEEAAFCYGDEQLEMVKEYNYLGTVFSSSTLGRKACDQTVNKE